MRTITIGRYLLLIALLGSVAWAQSLSSLYQSNGSSCESIPVGKCIPCSGYYYVCDNDTTLGYGCTYHSDSSCSDSPISVEINSFCSADVCSISLIPEYEFSVASNYGVSLYYELAYVGAAFELSASKVSIRSLGLRRYYVRAEGGTHIRFESGVYDDGSYLTNQGLCMLGENCTAADGMTYMLSPAGNSSVPVFGQSSGLVLVYDAPVDFSASEDISFQTLGNKVYISEEEVENLQLNLLLTEVTWDNFKLESFFGMPQLTYQVRAGSDFATYTTVLCDEDDGSTQCELYPEFSFSGIISYLHDADEPSRFVEWEEQVAFALFD